MLFSETIIHVYSFLRFLVEPLPWKKWKPWCIIIIPVLRMKAMFSLKEHTSIMILLVIRTQTNISNEIRPLHHGHIPILPTPQIRHRHAQWAPRSLPIDSVSVDTPPAAPCRWAHDRPSPTTRPCWRPRTAPSAQSVDANCSTPRCRRPPARCDLHLAEDWSCLKIHGFTWISTGKMMIHSKKITLRYFQTNGYKWSFHQPQWPSEVDKAQHGPGLDIKSFSTTGNPGFCMLSWGNSCKMPHSRILGHDTHLHKILSQFSQCHAETDQANPKIGPTSPTGPQSSFSPWRLKEIGADSI